jgi:ABC-type transport system involved in cytochrome c biogenesis permease subunit
VNFGFKGLLVTLYQRVILSYKTTLIGIALAGAGAALDYFAKSPNSIVSWVAGTLGTILVLVKDRNGWTVPNVTPALLAAALLGMLSFATPARADSPASGPLAVQLNKDFSLHLNVSVPAFGYSITQKKLLGQITLGVTYVLDYREKIAIGFGGGFAQTNDNPGATLIGMLAGPVLNAVTAGGVGLRPAVLYEYKWAGAFHENVIAGTLALQF